jgi:mannosyltransferase
VHRYLAAETDAAPPPPAGRGETGAPRPTSLAPLFPARANPPTSRAGGARPGSQRSGLRRQRHRDRLTQIALAGVALILYSWEIGSPSASRDETATLGVARLSLSGILDTLQGRGAVHGLYYVIAHSVLYATQSVGVDPLITLRALSATAMAAAGIVLFRLARELAGRGTGLLAAALFTASPLSARYAQEARSYALVVLAATAATYILVLNCGHPGAAAGYEPRNAASTAGRASSRRLPRWWIGYSMTLAVAVLLNLMTVALLLAHLAYLFTFGRSQLRAWASAVAAAGLPIAALALLAVRQSSQIASTLRATPRDLVALATSEYASRWVFTSIGLALAFCLVTGPFDVRRKSWPGDRTTLQSLALGATWSTLPVLTLWSMSFVDPLWVPEYVLFTLPGTALGLASAIGLLIRALGSATAALTRLPQLWGLSFNGRRRSSRPPRPS